MTIPANADGTYFSFDNYDVANPGALQVPHDASVKVSFDTLQIIDDISVSYGNWGKASYLEPITIDFPQFGSGGATQVITHSKITIKSITKLQLSLLQNYQRTSGGVKCINQQKARSVIVIVL